MGKWMSKLEYIQTNKRATKFRSKKSLMAWNFMHCSTLSNMAALRHAWSCEHMDYERLLGN